MRRLFYGLFILIAICLSVVATAEQNIRFGVIYFYPPFVFSSKSGYIHGFDIDVASAVCQQLKVQCTFTPMSLSDLFTSLNQGRVDAIMGAISITPERQVQFD